MARPKDPNSIRSKRERARLEKQEAARVKELEERAKLLEEELQQEKEKASSEKEQEPTPTQEEYEDFDLASILAEPTELKGRAEETPTLETPPSDDPDFAPEPALKMQKEAGKVKIFTPAELSKFLITIADVVQQFVLPFFYRRFAFDDGEFAAAKLLMKRVKDAAGSKSSKTIDLSESDNELLNTVHEYSEFIKKLPYSSRETDLLKIPLEAWLESTGFHLNPGWALLMAFSAVNMSRVTPMIAAAAEKQERATKSSQNEPPNNPSTNED